MHCINLPCQILIDVPLRTAAHGWGSQTYRAGEVDAVFQELTLVSVLCLAGLECHWTFVRVAVRGAQLTPRDTVATQTGVGQRFFTSISPAAFHLVFTGVRVFNGTYESEHPWVRGQPAHECPYATTREAQ